MKKILILLLTFSYCSNLWASLMIAPTRVMFDDRTRSMKVSLINASSETKTYKLYWRHLMQKQTGGYQELTEDQRRYFPSADRMIRFSPRAVTLAPQERQTVRLSLRRPDNLEPGEYRSHLAFEAIDDAAPTKEAERGVGIQVKINMAFSIPVVVRHRVSNVEVELTKPEFFSVMHNNEQKYLMQFRIINKGNASAFGNLKAYWQTGANTFSETPTGILNNVSVFTENPQRFMNLGLKEIPNRPTLLKLVYEGAQEMNGKIIDEIIVEADPKSFSSAY